ncbi:MAG: LysM peptidoglycan-binding domain-containing protein, partial [Thiobacillus sp.]|nr:LysM peptidoglycan-binding domain-containing protein [Thiobacillus sp.]
MAPGGGMIGVVAGGGARVAWLGVMLLGLVACTASGPAPVSDRSPARTAVKSVAPRPATPQIALSTNGLHTIQRGDTLYGIAFANGLDYREIAIWNQLESADLILVGQVLRLTPPPGAVEIRPLDDEPVPSARPLAEPPVLREPQAVLLAYSEANWAQASGARPVTAVAPAAVRPAPVAVVSPAPATAASGAVDSWLWPVAGTLAGRFGAAGGKGIDIVGQRNAPVKAVAP